MAEGLRGAGLNVTVREAATGPGWLVLAVHTATVDETFIAGLRPRLGAIAEAAGGLYDGWEASATP